MKTVAWLTDVHLNFVEPTTLARLAGDINETGADAVLIGGDIGEADSFADYLRDLSDRVPLPIYFVLGNHDYYRASIAAVRAIARGLHREGRNLHWLPESGVVPLSNATALIGHGGWGDGRVGDFLASDAILNDYLLIEELRECTRAGANSEKDILTPRLLNKVQSLGDEAAAHLAAVLPEALDRFEHILVLTHVPPFHEACWHEGQLSDINWAPHFTCASVGAVLESAMATRSDRTMAVLCGHTHCGGEAQISGNLHVITGAAEYTKPVVQRVVEIG